jgi:hypothetical protein
MSFVSEYNLGRDESTTYFLASLACSICELLHSGRSLHSQTGEAQADGASHRRGHRPFHGLAPYYSFRVPHLPSAYCKTTVAQPGFLPWNPFYATLRTFLCAPSHCTCVLCWKDMIRAMAFRVAGTSNWEILCTTYCTSQNITTDTPQSY